MIARALARRAARTRIPVPLSEAEQIEAALPEGWRRQNAPPVGTWEHDAWALGRDWKKQQIQEEHKQRNPAFDDPFSPMPPLINTPDDGWR